MQCDGIAYTSGVAGLLIVGLAVVFLVAYQLFLSRLANEHQEIWSRLGKPGLLGGEGTAVDWGVTKFLWRRTYREAGDPNLTCYGNIVISVYLLGAAAMLGFITLIFAGSNKWSWLGMECVWLAVVR